MEIAHFIQAHHLQDLAYLIIFGGMLFEATFFLFSAMFLLSQHALNPELTIAIVVLGAFTEEVIWYYIGLKLGNVERVARWTGKASGPVDKHLLAHPFHTLLLSKFVYGLHRAVLARAGMVKLGLRRFMRNAFASTAIWLGAMGILGYFFSESYDLFRKYINYAELAPLVLFVIYFFLDFYLSKKFRKNL